MAVMGVAANVQVTAVATSKNRGSSKKQSSLAINEILLNAADALNFAKECAPLIPVPLVASIFASAKVIVDAAQNVRQNKEDCVRLAGNVASFVRDICQELRGRETLIDERLKQALESLDGDLNGIKTVVTELASQGLFKRIGNRANMAARLLEYTAKLDFTLQVFKAMSNLRVELKLEQIERRTAVMDARAHSERMWDGQYRIYRRADLHLLQRIGHYKRPFVFTGETSISTPESASDKYQRAEIDGRVVVVKFHEGPPESFQDTLAHLKSVWHPNVVQLEGYSSDSDVLFHVIKGELSPLVDHMMTFDPGQRIIEYYRVMSAVWGARAYLAKNNFGWHGNTGDLMFDPRSGDPVLGARDDLYMAKVDTSLGGFQHRVFRAGLLLGAVQNTIPDKYVFSTPERLGEMERYHQAVHSSFTSPDKSDAALEKITLLWSLCRLIPTVSTWTTTSRLAPAIGDVGYFPGNIVSETNLVFLDKMPELHTRWEPSQLAVSISSDDKDLGVHGRNTPISFDTNARIELEARTCSNARAFHFWKYLALHGPALAKQNGLRLEDLVVVSNIDLHFSAKSAPTSSTPLAEGEPSSMFFHTAKLPSQVGEIPDRWGYFSKDSVPLQNDEPVPVVQAGDFYKSTLPAISAHTHTKVLVHFTQLGTGDAEIVHWIHQVFKPSPASTSEGGPFIEEVQ